MMTISSSFRSQILSLRSLRTYGFAAVFIAGNLLLPQLCHLMPDGGKIFLPIYFFTLVASYKFGIKVGLLTAVFSPLLNHLLFGMPPLAVLPVLLVKSSLLAVAAAWIARRSCRLSVWHIAGTVLAYQLAGGCFEWLITGSFNAALQDFTWGLPGILVQVIGGWLVLKLLAAYEY